MSRDEERSAIDALVEENLALRDRLGKPTAEPTTEPSGSKREGASGDDTMPDVDHAEGLSEEDGARSKPRLSFTDVESLVDETDRGAAGELAEVIAERDSYLADSQRLAAEFANFRKQSDKRVADAAAAQSAGLVRNLLPVIDACDSAIEQDPESAVIPIRSALLTELEKSGLELLAPEPDVVFDPEMHEAVMHEAVVQTPSGSGGSSEPTVAEVFRAGYVWKGKVLRPAMVKVVG